MKRFCAVVSLLVLSQIGSGQYSFDSTRLILDLKVLSADSLEGRKAGSEGGEKARNYILKQLKEMDVEAFVPGYEQSFPVAQATGVNVLGVIPGNKKETIVISAHYDHLGIRNNVIFNGADDNASGTAAILAIARYFKQHKPDHRIIIAFFDAEEMGLRGSAYFVNAVDLQKETIVLNVNLDMVSRSDKNELYASGTFHNPVLKQHVEHIPYPKDIKILFGHDNPAQGRDDWTSQSDQQNFHIKKIPFLYFGVEDHPDYHRATDKFEKVNRTFYANSVEAILQAIKALDKKLN
jgi:Zn-dependent M28 family amino/carboxypeptidase